MTLAQPFGVAITVGPITVGPITVGQCHGIWL